MIQGLKEAAKARNVDPARYAHGLSILPIITVVDGHTLKLQSPSIHESIDTDIESVYMKSHGFKATFDPVTSTLTISAPIRQDGTPTTFYAGQFTDRQVRELMASFGFDRSANADSQYTLVSSLNQFDRDMAEETLIAVLKKFILKSYVALYLLFRHVLNRSSEGKSIWTFNDSGPYFINQRLVAACYRKIDMGNPTRRISASETIYIGSAPPKIGQNRDILAETRLSAPVIVMSEASTFDFAVSLTDTATDSQSLLINEYFDKVFVFLTV